MGAGGPYSLIPHLRTPVRIRDEVYGNLYLAEKQGRGVVPPYSRPVIS